MIRILHTFILCFIIKIGTGQVLNGKVVDSESKTPLTYVNISHVKSPTGTTTNEDGAFQLKLAVDDTLTFSYLGYETRKFATNDLISSNLDTISLDYTGYNLPGVMITDITGKELIYRAVQNIEENYVQKPYLEKGFYNEELIHNDGRLFSYGEASLQSLKRRYRKKPRLAHSYQKRYDEKAFFVKGFYEDFREILISEKTNEELLFPTIFGGATMSITLDVLKSSISFLMREQINNYIFNIDGITLDGDDFSYIIKFEPKNAKGLYEGEVVLRDKDYVIESVRFKPSQAALNDYNKEHKKNNILSREYSVNYKNTQHGVLLSTVKTKSLFYNVASQDTLENILTYTVTDVDFEQLEIKGQPLSRFDDLESIVPSEEDYWEGQTTIVRSEKIQEKLDSKRKNYHSITFAKGNWSGIKKRAQRENKLIFVDIYTTWCQPCRDMDRYTFTEEEVVEVMEENYLAYKLDLERNPSHPIIKTLNVQSIPTLVIATPWGQILNHRVGYQNAESLAEFLQNIAAEINVESIKKEISANKDDEVALSHAILNNLKNARFISPTSILNEAIEKKKTYNPEEIKFILEWVMIFEGDFFRDYLIDHKEDFYAIGDSTIINDHLYNIGLSKALSKKYTFNKFHKFIKEHIPAESDYYKSLAAIDYYKLVLPDSKKKIISQVNHYSSFPISDWDAFKPTLLSMIMEAEDLTSLTEIEGLLMQNQKNAISYEWEDLRCLLLYKSGKKEEAISMVDGIRKDALNQGVNYVSVLYQLKK